jgi:hypothetical protein
MNPTKLFGIAVLLIFSVGLMACSAGSVLIESETSLQEIPTSLPENSDLPVTETPEPILAGQPEDATRNESVGEAVESASHSTYLPENELFLFAPIRANETYLMNREGRAVYTWESNYTPGNSVYLLENGNLLHTGTIRSNTFDVGGSGGIVEEIAPDGSVIWSFKYADDGVHLHHDIEPMPNGNILMIAWEFITAAEAVVAGRNPNTVNDSGLWPDHIVEVDPATNQIVWEWHVWDHLIQDHDPSKANYGVVADHPELIDVNFVTGRSGNPDWNHTNSIDYNLELDQILLSVHGFSEIWIIDHSTTMAEAAGHSGGKSRMGGDLLYRWGNPQAYAVGTPEDQIFFRQHDAQWIPGGYPGAGNILVFNNDQGPRDEKFSSVDEIVPLVDEHGRYLRDTGQVYEPTEPIWRFVAENPSDFFSKNISGAQRLPNGNTLICNGEHGIFFEVSPQNEIVWQFDYGSAVFRISGFSMNFAGLVGLDFVASSEPLKAENSPPKNNDKTGRPVNDGPPPRAIEACNDLNTDAACTVNRRDGTQINGTCNLVQNELACIPVNQP